MRSSGKRNAKPGKGRRRVTPIELLESRELLTATTETFVGPNLSAALRSSNPSAAVISKMEAALEAQLKSGPLADLSAGRVDGNGFITESQSLEASYEAYSNAQLTRQGSLNVTVKLQGEHVVADLLSVNQQNAVGLISNANLPAQAELAINTLTGGPIYAQNTSLGSLNYRTTAFVNQLNTLIASYSLGTVTLDQLDTTLNAEAQAYDTDIHAGLLVNHPQSSSLTDVSVVTLENASANIEGGASPNAVYQLIGSVNLFYQSTIGTFGVFGPLGQVSTTIKQNKGVFPPSPSRRAGNSTVYAVSGTASSGGTATLEASLSSATSGLSLANRSVVFTLDGVYEGTAVTNNDGLATVSNVTSPSAPGPLTGAIVVTFAGDTNDHPSQAAGDLVVSQAGTAFSGVSGTANYGGTATLSATLYSTATDTIISGQTVDFTLDGTSVGSAVTNSTGVATLANVPTSDAAGTDTGGVVVSFAGSTDYSAAPNGTGNLVVNTAATALAAVSGSATYGTDATLTATLSSTVTNQPISGQTVTFTLDGSSVGSATTTSSGVATLTGITTTNNAGIDSGGVIASFAGSANYSSAPSAAGNLTVAQAATSLSAVSGSATFGGTATLVATLKSSATNTGIVGQIVTFMLDKKAVGTATTNSSGVATLTGVTTADGAGVDTGGITASFAGSANYVLAVNATGDLTVAKSATILGSIGGNASYGGKATLTGTLTSSTTNAGVAGETLNFSLDNTSVGTAVTNSAGVATLTGVATSQGAGTDTNGVIVTYTGSSNYIAAPTGTGNLVVNQAATSLSAVSGSATFGGTATLVATLNSSVTNGPIQGQTVTFQLDDVTVGTATTNASGVATLTGVATTDGGGTDTGGITASFSGSSNYAAAANATGDLAVSPAATTIGAVSGSSTYGGPATLVATLTSSVTSGGAGGQTVSFTLNGIPVGTAVTNSSGVAQLTGVTTAAGAGTDTGAVVASFAGSADYLTTTPGTGDLDVAQAATVLSDVSGTATGGFATLLATLTSSVTGLPVTAGENVTFTLDNTIVGTAQTNALGVATLSDIPTADPVGTDPGGVIASYSGSVNYIAATPVSGDLVVS